MRASCGNRGAPCYSHHAETNAQALQSGAGFGSGRVGPLCSPICQAECPVADGLPYTAALREPPSVDRRSVLPMFGPPVRNDERGLAGRLELQYTLWRQSRIPRVAERLVSIGIPVTC